MLRTGRLCAWIFIGMFILLIPSIRFIKFADELAVLLLLSVASLDCLINRRWDKYRGLWIAIGIMGFYLVYSLVFCHYNVTSAILLDSLTELKPFIPFFIFLSVGLVFTKLEKLLLKSIAVLNCAVCAVIFIFFRESLDTVMQHVSYVGLTAFVSGLVFILCSIENDGRVSRLAILGGILLMSVGLLGTRAKFFGSFVVAIYFLLFYRPGLSKQSLWKIWATVALVVLGVAGVSWYKFDYYFISGNSGRLTPDVIESFARPVMYLTGLMIILSHIPFGSGLGSFASYASGEYHYSTIYYDYGINNIDGLSPGNTGAICDAYYPALAQFGLVGIALFVYFWIFIGRRLKTLIKTDPERNRIYYSIGWTAIIFLLIESVASTTFVQGGGMCAMMILGAICSKCYSTSVNKTASSSNTTDNNFSFINTPSTWHLPTP